MLNLKAFLLEFKGSERHSLKAIYSKKQLYFKFLVIISTLVILIFKNKI